MIVSKANFNKLESLKTSLSQADLLALKEEAHYYNRSKKEIVKVITVMNGTPISMFYGGRARNHCAAIKKNRTL